MWEKARAWRPFPKIVMGCPERTWFMEMPIPTFFPPNRKLYA